MFDRLLGRELSLGARVALAVTVLLAAGGVLVSAAAFAYGRQAAQEAYDRLLVGAANDIAASVSVGVDGLIVDLPTSAFELLALAPNDRVAYRVQGPSGEFLTGYHDLPKPPHIPAGEAIFYDAEFIDEPARFTAVSRQFAERDLSGSVQVIVGQTRLARRALALDITRRALILLGVAGIIMALLAGFVVRSALRPLDRLTVAFANRDPYDLTPVQAKIPREAAGMVQALNGFMGRIDNQVSSMRNLISDSAHQLRTPVAALRAQADLAAEEPDLKRRAAIVARIHKRTVDLGHLLDQMLSRALVIHRTENLRRESVDLRDVALEVTESDDHLLMAPDTDIRLSITENPVLVAADTLSLVEAAKNLLSNAVKYGHSPITVGVGTVNGKAELWVEDRGSGPNPFMLEQIGTRFADRNVAAGKGSGLGLSIAHAVARAYHGDLILTHTENGFRAVLVLPLPNGNAS